MSTSFAPSFSRAIAFSRTKFEIKQFDMPYVTPFS